MKKLAIVTTAFSLLVGCAGSPMQIASMNPDQLKTQTSEDLCKAYSHKQKEEIKAELISRKAVSEMEWAQVATRHIAVGMSETALICSWGQPSDVNTTTTAQGTKKQWVYRSCSGCKAQYIYTTNGRVTAMQN